MAARDMKREDALSEEENGGGSDRGFLIAQAVMLAAIVAVVPLALFVVDVSPSAAPAERRDSRDAIFAFEGLSPRSPVACPGGLADAGGGVPVAEGGLADDCAILLSAAPILAGGAALNWSAAVPITEWDGVILDGDPLRVAAISLTAKGLDGEIPPSLARLSSLRGIALYGNNLSGEIPAELGNLTNLAVLDLGDNDLSGAIPPSLGNLESLTRLDVGFNRLGGEIPAELRRLERMEWLILAGNETLGGSLTAALAAMPDLAYLNASDTRITGCVPPNLRELDGFWGMVVRC